MNWPNDVDGDVLRRLEADGFNFDKEVEIDFNIDFNHWPLSNSEIETITNLYPHCSIYDPDEEDIEDANLIGYVQFQLVGKVSYEFVISTQEEVTVQMKECGGWCNSWGVMQEQPITKLQL